jgi:hypothetical protein
MMALIYVIKGKKIKMSINVMENAKIVIMIAN